MRLVTPSSLLLGMLLASPALVQAFTVPSADVGDALLRFVLAVIVAGAGLSFLRGLVATYREATRRRQQAAVLEDGATATITSLPATGIASDDVLPA